MKMKTPAAALAAVLAFTMSAAANGESMDKHNTVPDEQQLQKRIVRLSVVTVDPAQLETYKEFAAECGKRSMAEEPGVIFMYSMADQKQPNRISILEIYADQEAYEKHIRSAHFQKYKQRTLQMVRKLELLDQTALIPEMRMK